MLINVARAPGHEGKLERLLSVHAMTVGRPYDIDRQRSRRRWRRELLPAWTIAPLPVDFTPWTHRGHGSRPGNAPPSLCGPPSRPPAGLRWADIDLDAGVATIEQQRITNGHVVTVGPPRPPPAAVLSPSTGTRSGSYVSTGAGVDLKAVRAQLGHSSIVLTAHCPPT
jgi:hypothetical protein